MFGFSEGYCSAFHANVFSSQNKELTIVDFIVVNLQKFSFGPPAIAGNFTFTV